MFAHTLKNEAPGGRTYIPNLFKIKQNRSKMPPWIPLGVPWAPTLLPEPSRSRPGEALGRPGVPQKVVVGGQGASWGEKLMDFTLLGEGPGGALGGHFRSFFAVGPAGTEKVRKMKTVCIFGCVYFQSVLSLFCSPYRRRPRKRTLKKQVFVWKVFKISLVGHFLAQRKKSRSQVNFEVKF